EIMLQQTQVERVVPKYLAFLKRFPTPRHLAEAETGAVLRLWSGLGYNRRAVNLKQAAEIIAQRGYPDDLSELPGIGPYTSAAVQAFAFNRDVPVVDTNIRRIFSRYFFAGKGTQERIDAKVAEQVPAGRSRIWNNALMDFGSMLCTASSPACASCPLKRSCAAFKKGTVAYLRIAPPQKKFEGSRRQTRGAILRLLLVSSLTEQELADKLGKNVAATRDIVDELVREKLAVRRQRRVSLP
ncbi:MAG TPA: A/G-specific adenine glycosylase, partial [Candidatus Binatia bacterium]|nr:A/G-specific adenine glycosylase [Candidatus Binatia bacterium]